MTTTHLPAVYRRAIQIIRINGWHQGGFVDVSAPYPFVDCPVCAAGAIRLAVTGHPIQSQGSAVLEDAEQFLADHLGPSPAGAVSLIATWNDDPARTVDEVLAALESAAVAAESGGAA
ncbi:DUF6197 family protein [Embleya sp. NPDC001921]